MMRIFLVIVFLTIRGFVSAQVSAGNSGMLSVDSHLMSDSCELPSLESAGQMSVLDSIRISPKEEWGKSGIYKLKPLQLIVPAAMIGVGVIGLENHWIIRGNHEMREELQESGHGQFSIDDFTQFAPAVAVYGLNLCGVRGEHNWGERTIIMGTATLLTLSTVFNKQCSASRWICV